MRTVATTLIVLGLGTLVLMWGLGLIPNRSLDPTVDTLFGIALGTFMLGGLAHIVIETFAGAQPVEAEGIDTAAEPIREFGFRFVCLRVAAISVVAAAFVTPLLVVVPVLWLRGAEAAKHPAVLGGAGFAFLLGLVVSVLLPRVWSARVLLYPDRLAVRGADSNGSLRWDEVTAFTCVETGSARHGYWWTYHLAANGRSLPVSGWVESPGEFVREVESRTGLTLLMVPHRN